MSTQEHIQKDPLATIANQSEQKGFATPGLTTEQDTPSDQQFQDLKTQLNRAERFGHSVSKMPVPTSPSAIPALQTKAPASGPGNSSIQREAIPEDEDELQTKLDTAQSTQSQPIQQATSSGSDRSMPKPVRAKMENAFGTRFSDVSIHTESAQAKTIGALAYTQGSQIHFAPGQYNPNSPAGQSLLGHELTHVVQQRAGRVPTPRQNKGLPINADPALEQEADRLGAKAAQGQQVQVPGMILSGAVPVQRSTEPVPDMSFGSILDGVSSIDAPTMDLNTYKTLNQHVESLLPQLQRQVMKQPIPGDMQNAMQCAKGGGGGKGGGMMSKLNPMSKGGGGGGGGAEGGGGGGGLLGAIGGIAQGIGSLFGG